MAQLLEGSPRDDGELEVGVRWGGLEGGEACEGGIKPVVPGGKRAAGDRPWLSPFQAPRMARQAWLSPHPHSLLPSALCPFSRLGC